MAKKTTPPRIDIRPDVSVYATYKRLSYKPWYAIAEFVDNSTQNYYDHKAKLMDIYKAEKPADRLRVEIVYDSERNILTVLDNAHGMDMEELTRAVVLDRPPPTTTGRCEYGMGLKTAACWFGRSWTIHTSKLGSRKEFQVTVNVDELVKKHTKELPVTKLKTNPESHFTRITIHDLYKPIRGRTTKRILDQLGSMYRHDLRSGEIDIFWNGQPLSFDDPNFLEERFDGKTNTWHKEVSFDVPWDMEKKILHVKGWIGIRIPGSQRDAGFALMRRGRVIVGGPGEGFKPVEIFGQGNTFRSQRLVGELHMDHWPVTQAKDAFDWSGDLEDAFIEELRRVCQDYMEKAEGHREKAKPITTADMELSSEKIKEAVQTEQFGKAISEDISFPEPKRTPAQEQKDVKKLIKASIGPVQFKLEVGEYLWKFRLHWQDKLTDSPWMEVNYPQDDEIDIFLNMAHPFIAPYLKERELLELLQKFVLSLALAEKMARQTSRGGLISPGDLRMYLNKVLKHTSSIEVQNE